MTRVTEQITGAGLPVDITKPVKDVLAQTKPAVNEFKANEFISYIFNEGISLQTGAFKNKTNAFNLFKKLVRISGKPTIVVYDHKYYKVRVSGFLNHLTARKFAFKLTSLKFPVFYLPYYRHNFAIQIGEFENKKDATEALDKWSNITGKPIILIIDENDRYKVRIQGLSGRTEAESILKELNITH